MVKHGFDSLSKSKILESSMSEDQIRAITTVVDNSQDIVTWGNDKKIKIWSRQSKKMIRDFKIAIKGKVFSGNWYLIAQIDLN